MHAPQRFHAGHRPQQGLPAQALMLGLTVRAPCGPLPVRTPGMACQVAVTWAWLRPGSRVQAPRIGSARRRPGMACQGLVPGFGAALRYDERARRELALTGRRPQPMAAAAVTRRPCGDPIKKAPSARGRARRQLRMRGDATMFSVQAHTTS